VVDGFKVDRIVKVEDDPFVARDPDIGQLVVTATQVPPERGRGAGKIYGLSAGVSEDHGFLPGLPVLNRVGPGPPVCPFIEMQQAN
jgi:hypothetical protein